MTRAALTVLAWILILPGLASAEVVKMSIATRSTVADGHSFGTAGAYEKLTGKIEFALDPNNPRNKAIADLQFASRAQDGKVHFSSDVHILRPVDTSKGNGVLLFEIANRGNKLIFGYFNGIRNANTNDPSTLADFGDAFLMREGYTLVWVGWQFDVAPPQVRVEAPAVDMRASPQPDTARFSFIVDERTTQVSPRDFPAYHAALRDDPAATLTVRDKHWDNPVAIPRNAWRIVESNGRVGFTLASGFEPGRVYEVAYKATGAVVAGVGLAALRDAGSAFIHRTDLPVRGERAYIFGASQSGRLLRQFLNDGFNLDEQNRPVFALAWPHIAGAGLGSFNERFAMPGYSSFPATRRPFTYPELLSKYTGNSAPKIIATNTPVEYWGQGRAAALTHASEDGARDGTVPDNVRIYLLAGTQHGEAAFPPTQGAGQQLSNPTPQVAVMHALLRAAHQWVTKGTPPPESRHPRFSDGTLVQVSDLQFPKLPGIADPRGIEGPGEVVNARFKPLPFLVPRVDADGNETSGIRVPDLSVPLATATGWNFRDPRVGNPSTAYALLGSYIPFAASRAQREARKDPRPSIEERYSGKEDYIRKIRSAANTLIQGRYLLEEDLPGILNRADAHWSYAMRSNGASAGLATPGRAAADR